MNPLEETRKRWIEERPLYQDFVEFLKRDIQEKLQAQGIRAEVTGRAKELDSLLKKLLLKKDRTYESLADKAGLRIVVRFRSEIQDVQGAITNNYNVVKIDDKTAALEVDRFRYQGLHLDVELTRNDEDARKYGGLKAEVQIRTKSQHLWSEFDHELAYKTNIEIPDDVRRRLFILLALLEMADREFESVDTEIRALPNASALRLLFILEKQFYKVNPTDFSKELSVQVINAIAPIYELNEGQLGDHLEAFCRNRVNELDVVFRESQGRSLFLSQPEVLMLFDLLERVPYRLTEQWAQYFPASELEELARIWGKPLK
jgi:ppGpp synthetase/RelA/SpoT-type nucleotidyltranferase